MGFGDNYDGGKNQTELQQIRESLTITPYQKQFEEPQFETRVSQDLSGLSGTALREKREAYKKEHVEKADSAIQRVLKSAEKMDTRGEYMKEQTHYSSRSVWLLNRSVPTEKDLSSDIDLATKNVKIKELSDSQKLKRGEKFKKKAGQQAKMINIMNQCNWQRDESLNDLLVHGKNARYGYDLMISARNAREGQMTSYHDDEKETFLENVGNDVDRVSVQMKDLSFYFEQKRASEKDSKVHPVNSYHYKTLEEIADPADRVEGYGKVLEEFDKLDLSIFDYKNNDEFMTGEGEKAFVKRYAALRAFSHAKDMIREIGRGKLGDKKYFQLSAKAGLVEDILKDYNSRAILLQSPYYVLLAGKDFDDLSNDDIEQRIKNTKDILAKSYMEQVLERRKSKRFGKGSKAADILNNSLKNLSFRTIMDAEEREALIKMRDKNRDEDLVRRDYMSNTTKIRARLKGGIRRLTSLIFRKKNNIPVDDQDEKELEGEYEKERKNQDLDFEKWASDKEKKMSADYKADNLKNDQGFLSLKDPDLYYKRELSDTMLSVIKVSEKKVPRQDYFGISMHEHMEKYKKGGKYGEKLVEEDVTNLVNNIILDDVLSYKDVDFDMFHNDFNAYLKGFGLFLYTSDRSVMELKSERQRRETEIGNIKLLLEKEPQRRQEFAEELEKLEQEKKTFSVREKTLAAFVVKYKNRSETVRQYFLEKIKSNAIVQAKLILEKEKGGVYLDSMKKKLAEMQTENDNNLAYQVKIFNEAKHTSLTEKLQEEMKGRMPEEERKKLIVTDPFTPAQKEIIKILEENTARIEELKRMGKEGEEEALEILQETRRAMEDYWDPEYQKLLGIEA